VTAPATPRPTWTWAQSWWLELGAYGWLIGVTAPATTLLTVSVFWIYGAAAGPDSGIVAEPALETVLQGLVSVLIIDVVTAVFAFGGVLVSLPFTQLLGLLTVSVRSRGAHVAMTSLLAGTLGALSVCWFGPWLAVPLALATGAAGALARRGEFRRADSAEIAPSDGSGGASPTTTAISPE
jgi:hypothetical protein